MSRWHDLVDWVGGYPFEVARPEEILDFVRPRGFELERLTTCGGGLGCNQFVFRAHVAGLSAWTVRSDPPARFAGWTRSSATSPASPARASRRSCSGLLTVVLTARILTPEGYAVIAYMTLGGDADHVRRQRLERGRGHALRPRGARPQRVDAATAPGRALR